MPRCMRAVLQVMEGLVPEYDARRLIRERSGSILPGIAPSNVYTCSDGEYMIGANKDSLWKRLAEAMGQPELGDDQRYATHLARGRQPARTRRADQRLDPHADDR